MIKVFPASPEQEGVWFHAKKIGTAYWNFVERKSFKGSFDIEVLQKAFNTVLHRHDSLRTKFRLENDKLFQVIHPFADYNDLFLHIADDEIYQDEQVDFDLENDFLLRFTVRETGNTFILTLVISHIITDSFSMRVFWEEMSRYYNSLLEGKDITSSSACRQYVQFVEEQQAFLETPAYLVQKIYWLDKLSTEVTPLNFQFYVPGGEISIYNKEVAIPLQLFLDARSLSLRKKILFSAVFQAAYYILLYKLSGNDRIVICNVINGRGFGKNKYNDAIGLFAKRLINAQSVKDSNTIAEVLTSVNSELMDSFNNSNISYEELLREINQNTKRGLGPLFQVLFNIIKSDGSKIVFDGLGENDAPYFEDDLVGDILTDMGLTIIDDAKQPRLRLDIKCDTLFQPMADLLIHGFFKILHECVYNISAIVGDIGFATDSTNEFVKVFNNTAATYPEHLTVIDLFTTQCIQNPEAIAVICNGQWINYKDLDERSSQLAHYLKRKGVCEEMLVPICTSEPLEIIVGILGIMKAGGAYIPIDPAYPSERINYILKDISASIILGNAISAKLIPASYDGEFISLGEDRIQIGKERLTKPQISLTSKNLAYVIYTSGSTGKPKGVMIEHRSLVNYLLNCRERYLSDNSVSGSYMYLPFTFDASLTALFVPLICGQSIVAGIKGSTEVFSDIHFSANSPYDFLKLTPAHLYLLETVFATDQNVAISKKLVLGGEALQPSHFKFYRDNNIELEILNEYGPTETTVGCSNYSFITTNNIQHIPIGVPLNNVQMYILDKKQNLVAPGITGEIYIGGIQVARGYLNQPALTSERFIKDRFSNKDDARLYRTGDMGRWLPDGNMEFLGRIDDQVKIRGYRVEPGEIETLVIHSGLVKQCVVIADKDKMGDNRLAGYVVANDRFDRYLMIKYLGQHLPDYMVPHLWITLESIPLTHNGKVDKRALPKAEAGTLSDIDYAAPRNEAEVELIKIWQQLLDAVKVGIHDDFFLLGGHSLLALRMISAAQHILPLTIGDVFDYSTIAGLTENIVAVTTSDNVPLLRAEKRPDRIPLSFNQERLWFIDRVEGSSHYHIPWILRVKGSVNIAALEKAFAGIVNRHEVLRTIFPEEDGVCCQQILEAGSWKMKRINYDEYANDKDELRELTESIVHAPFDLSKDHLLRVHLIENVAGNEHLLIITLHHIAADGWSCGILVKELMLLYESYSSGVNTELPGLPIQYVDYAIWQRQYLQKDIVEKKLSYWRQKLLAVTPLLLPLDHPRPKEQSTRGESMELDIDGKLAKKLNKLSQSSGATLFMTMLTVFKILLYRWSGQTDICVGTPIACRTPKETENLIGFFINTLALRSDLSDDPSFRQLLASVRQTTLEAYDHQDMPFSKIVEELVTERDLSRSPVFQVMFVMQNTPKAEAFTLGKDIELSDENIFTHRVKFDLMVNIYQKGHGLGIYTEYCTDLFNSSTIQRMMLHYKELLASVVVSPGIPINNLQMLPDVEEKLVKEFNEIDSQPSGSDTLLRLFDEQCKNDPGRLALVFGDQQLSYQELEEKSNQLGRYLKSKGMTEETPVPVYIDRSPEMIISILAIMKAGGAYVPIDPEYPAERISYMLSDISAKLVLTSNSLCGSIHESFAGEIILVDTDWAIISNQSPEKLQSTVKAENLAYIIYTSGSTGRPKGVMIEHRNVIAMLQGFNHVAPAGNHPEDGLLVCSYAFDVSVWEIFISLCYGGTLHILTKDMVMDEEYIAHYIIEKNIGIAYLPPAFLPGIADHFEHSGKTINLKRLLVGVMSIRQEILQRYIDIVPGIRIINGYGPTETTICATFFPFVHAINPAENTPIGKPIKNYQVYILNERKMKSPIGVLGEICIAGNGVGRGYWNNQQLTSEVFIDDPFSTDQRSLLYCTGDLGKWTTGGYIEYAGRKDQQAKINGYRIEPGEIESVIRRSGLAQSTLVLIDISNQGYMRLVAYVVPSGDFNEDELIAYLRKYLPEYMIPRIWISLDNIPLTINGKIDREVLLKKIPAINSSDLYIAPRNETEAMIAGMLQELLDLEKVGAKDNFFILGGNSLLAIQLIARIRKKYKLQVPNKVIFQFPRVDQLAEYIDLFVEKVADKNDLVSYEVFEL
ncbi:MAG: amino acid adenylation domain-containing protein [Chitinophagaceae bacterium]